MYRAVGALLILGWSGNVAAQVQPNTLTLACKGTVTTTSMPEAKPEPISMGIIVNFTTRGVQGFGTPGLIDFPVKITGANDVTIAFRGEDKTSPSSVWSLMGSIDRVTGDVDATSMLIASNTSKIITQTVYALQCRPAQRMF
jgi:hypothetical protein